MNKAYYTNGDEVKSIDLPQYSDEAWTFHSGGPEPTDNEFYSKVAAVFRVANLSAEAIANMPFAIVDSNGEDVDSSDDWSNEVGFMPDPKELLRLWRLSLFMTNSAYAFRETVDNVDTYKYALVSSIEPVLSKDYLNELLGFTRRVGTTVEPYPLEEERIFWMWRRDHTTELLPSEYTEFQALMQAAGVIYYQDYYAKHFLSRGGILPTMLLIKGAPNKEERDRIEKSWDKIVRGFYKYLGKIFNAEAIEPKVIGEGMEALKDNDLYENKLSDIAMAAGMPLSLLKANSANFATAQLEYLQWFRDSVVPWAEFMAEAMNTLLFEPLGYRFDFRPEMTDPGQEDETQRAGAYRAYIDSGMFPSMAAQILGIELPAGTTDYTQLDRDYVLMNEMTAETSSFGDSDDADGEVVEPDDVELGGSTRSVTTTDIMEHEPATKTMVFIPTMEQFRELELWQTMAFRKCKRGESLDFDFENRSIPDDIAHVITVSLEHAETEDDVKMAFDLERFTFEVTETDGVQFSDSDVVSPALLSALGVQLQDAESIEEAKMISESVWADYP